MSSDFSGYLQLIRPLNLFLGAVSIFLGALVTGTINPLEKVILACVYGVFIMAGGYAINDYFDADIDRINKANRPIPSQKITPDSAFKFSIILFVLGVFVSIFVNRFSLFLALITSVGLFFYSARFKKSFLLGNLAVSLFSAMAFVFGAVSVARLQAAFIPVGFAFLFHLGREIIKDVEDQEADAVYCANTLPIRLGIKPALIAVTVILGLLVIFTFVPYVFDLYSITYFWIVLFGVDFIILLLLLQMWKTPIPATFKRVSLILKADMFVGLTAIYFGLPK